jgi:hypothetical protein
LTTALRHYFQAWFLHRFYFFTTKTKWKFTPFLKATAIIAAVLLGAFAIAFIIRSPEYIFGNLQSAFHYISSNQAHGYANSLTPIPTSFGYTISSSLP